MKLEVAKPNKKCDSRNLTGSSVLRNTAERTVSETQQKFSSGETTVSMGHLVLVTLYRWLSGTQEHMLLHTRQSSIQVDTYQVSHRYSCFSWWWTHSRPKHVKKWNKHTKKMSSGFWNLSKALISEIQGKLEFPKFRPIRSVSFLLFAWRYAYRRSCLCITIHSSDNER